MPIAECFVILTDTRKPLQSDGTRAAVSIRTDLIESVGDPPQDTLLNNVHIYVYIDPRVYLTCCHFHRQSVRQ